MTARISPKQQALLAAIGSSHFSFFDQGIAAGSGIWAEVLTAEAPATVSETPTGVATVANALVRKGLLAASEHEEGVWWELTEEGAAAALAAAGRGADAAPAAPGNSEPETLELLDLEARVEVAEGTGTVIASTTKRAMVALDAGGTVKLAVGSPEYAAVRPAAAAEAPAEAPVKEGDPLPEAEEEDLLGLVEEAEEAIVQAEDAAPELLAADHEVRMEGSYTVEEWSEDVEGYGTTEWIRWTFTDGSWALRRRRNVSGAWRTDFWGQEAGATKKVFTTSGAAKAARTAGKFTA